MHVCASALRRESCRPNNKWSLNIELNMALSSSFHVTWRYRQFRDSAFPAERSPGGNFKMHYADVINTFQKTLLACDSPRTSDISQTTLAWLLLPHLQSNQRHQLEFYVSFLWIREKSTKAEAPFLLVLNTPIHISLCVSTMKIVRLRWEKQLTCNISANPSAQC